MLLVVVIPANALQRLPDDPRPSPATGARPADWTLAAAITLASPCVALAQGTGANIGGVITDDTGGALPGVTVTITNKANGGVQTTVTGAAGNYRAVALQPAPYEVKAELSGFTMVKKDEIERFEERSKAARPWS